MAFQGDSIYWVEVEKIVPNPFQPRREFDEHKLRELADSVRMYGILQPLTVTRNEVQREDGTFYSEYELIAGERRLRASKIAGLTQVPVIIRDGEQSEQEKLELAIIENLQREDLNAIDRALAFRQLAELFKLSHAQVAQKVGRSREYVSNTIRLLALPQHMLDSVQCGDMSEGHARTLLMLTDRPQEQEVVFREVLLKKLSVREVERIARRIATDRVRKREFLTEDADIIEMEKKFMETLGTRVHIQKTDFGGKLTIDYFTVSDLEDMLKRIKVENQNIDQSDVSRLTTHTPVAMGAAPLGVAAVVPAAPLDPVIQSAENSVSTLSELYDDESDAVMEIPEAEALIDEEVTPAPSGVVEVVQVVSEAAAPQVAMVPENSNEVPVAPVELRVDPTVPYVPEVAVVPAEVVVPEPAPAPVPESDDSDLYSIRHFSV